MIEEQLILHLSHAIRRYLQGQRFDDVAEDVGQDYMKVVLQETRGSLNDVLRTSSEMIAAGVLPACLKPEVRKLAVRARRKAERSRGESLESHSDRISLASITSLRAYEREQEWLEDVASTPECREIIVAIRDGGCRTMREVAARLGVTPRTLYNRRKRDIGPARPDIGHRTG